MNLIKKYLEKSQKKTSGGILDQIPEKIPKKNSVGIWQENLGGILEFHKSETLVFLEIPYLRISP